MAQQVNIKIKINDNFKDVTVDAESLGDAIDQVTGKSDSLNTSIVRLGSISQIAEAASSAFGQLNAVFGELTDAYAAHSVADARLAQAMSNTMGASDEEVQSIKALCSAQQQLGVIGEDVQVAAAQELATYLEYSDSLKAIIPIMNDMAAQQYGLGASAESVTQIATMLGKVMNGQTEALSRYGYKFDEAQKQILQFGTEAERAAVLVDVVGESVGGMNAALAQTPAGKMQQMANTIGDWKEKMGQAVQSMMPFITGVNQIAQGVTTVTKLSTAFKALSETTLAAKVQSMALTVSQRTQAIAARALGVSETTAATATGALRAQIIALQTAMTLGLSLAITAVIELISRLISRSHDAADAIEEADEASKAFAQTSKDARSEIAMYQVKLEDIIKHHKNDAQAVDELNQKYGESFGYYGTAESWYKVLTEKSAAYCRQLGYEAQAKVYASQIAALQLEKDDNDAAARGLAASGGVWRRGFFQNHMTKEAKEIQANADRISQAMATAQSKFDACTQGMLAAQEELRGGMEETSEVASWQTMSLAQLTKAIQTQKGVVEDLAGVDSQQAREEAAMLKQMEARKKLLEGTYGLGSSSSGGSKDKLDGSTLIKDASSYMELGNNIKYYQNQLETANFTDAQSIALISQKITELQSLQEGLKLFAAALSGDLGIDDIEKQIDEKLDRLLDETLENVQKDLDKQWAEITKFDEFKNTLPGGNMNMAVELGVKVKGAEYAREQIETLQKMLAFAKGDQTKAIQDAIQYWSSFTENATAKGERFTGMLGDLSKVAQSLSGVVDENAAGWLSWGAGVLSAVAQALPAIAQLIGGQIAQAFAGAAAQSQSVPFPFNLVSLAASMTAVGAAVASIPKFAEGGVAFAPTIGLFGEAGPEAIVPLDRFPQLIGDTLETEEAGGVFHLVVRGDDLEYVMKRRMRKLNRM